MKRNFSEWFKTFRDSISSYDYYVDFEKVYCNVEKIRVELNILNTLVGSKDIEVRFKELLRDYPKTLDVIPILLAKRETEIYCQDENGGHLYRFCNKNINQPNIEEQYARYAYFMKKTGLFDLLQNHRICNLVDYVTGVETGLSSNGRKNRGGHLMEDLVEGFIEKACSTNKNIDYFKEMRHSEIEKKWRIDLSAISNHGKAVKRFDFVVKSSGMIYAIEANFYTSSGSKLNETARSYKTIANEAKTIKGFTFVWFTDGNGWEKAKRNLEETFDVMEHIYNIKDMENGVMEKLFK